MELRNYFTVGGEEGAATAFNSLSSNFWTLVANEPQWAKFLSLTCSDGVRVWEEARLEYLNCDPMRGGALRAVYCASILCPQSKNYTRVSLCNGAKEEIIGAALNYSGSGEEVKITAVIFLDTQSEEVKFCGGDNPLIKRLLGCGGELSFKIGWGRCNYPNIACVPSETLIEEKLPVEFTADENGFKFTASAPTYGNELVLYDANDTPLLRALRPYALDIGLKAGTIDEHGAILCDTNYTEEILTAQVDGYSMLRMDSHRVYDNIVKMRTADAISVGVAGAVATEPTGEYIAVYNASFAEVYKVTGAEPELKFRVPRTDEAVFVCRGGALALWDYYKLTIYEPDEKGDYVEYKSGMSSGTRQMLVREGNVYHGVCSQANRLYRFTFDGKTDNILERPTVGGEYFFLGRCGDAIAWGDRSLRVKTSDSDISGEFKFTALSSHRVKRTLLGMGDGFSVVDENGKTVILDFVHNTITEAPQIEGANGRLLYGDGRFYVYDHYNGVREIASDSASTGITSACLAGDRIWAVRDGKLLSYYCDGNGVALRVKAGSSGKNYFCNYRERKLKNLGGGARFVLS